jgi:hypothetical protein
MPALGPVAVRKRAAEAIVRLVGPILGDLMPAAGATERRHPLAAVVTRGAVLETHETVCAAAYTYQPDKQLNTTADPPTRALVR